MVYQKQMQFDKDIENILNGIEKLKMLKELKVKDFADDGGYADKLAQRLKSMKTTQLRRFFGAIKDIEKNLKGNGWDSIEAEFYLLKPKLAYAKGRRLIPNEFHQVVKTAMNKINVGDNDEEKKENYKRFVWFLEAVVAYHKFYGGE